MTVVETSVKNSELQKVSRVLPIAGVSQTKSFMDGNWILAKDQSKTAKDFRLLQLGNIGIRHFIDESYRWISKATFENLNCTLVKPGDILVSRMADPLARACIVPEFPYPCITAVDCAIVRVNEKRFDRRFVNYLFNSDIVRNQAEDLSAGTTRKRISRKNLERIMVSIPPLPVQRRIADTLEEVDKIEKLREQANQMTDKILQAVFSKMFGDDRYPKDAIENYVVRTEVRDPRYRPDEYFKYVDIAGIDNKSGQIAEVKDILGKDAPSRARRVIREDDVIVSTVRPNLNATAIVPKDLDNQICSTGFCVLRCKTSLNPKYLYVFTRRGEFIDVVSSQMKGASYPAVTNNDVLNVQIPIPPIDLQNKFASMVERVASLREKQNRSTQEINLLFNSLMSKAFKGELVRDVPETVRAPQTLPQSRTLTDYMKP